MSYRKTREHLQAAWRAMQVAAVPDNKPELAQRDHRRRLRLFAEMTVAWPIIE